MYYTVLRDLCKEQKQIGENIRICNPLKGTNSVWKIYVPTSYFSNNLQLTCPYMSVTHETTKLDIFIASRNILLLHEMTNGRSVKTEQNLFICLMNPVFRTGSNHRQRGPDP
jgi:hypothetical protein